MIIDFTVQNFRSLKDELIFSMNVDNPKGNLSENFVRTENDKVNVLKTAGIYGANASGKSNLLKAFKALSWIVKSSGDLKEGEHIRCYEPFRLSADTLSAPCSFEIEFIGLDKLRYVYAVAFNKTEIVSESLDYYPSRQKANLFKKNEGDTWETITFGGHYKGGTKRIPFFKNNSYLSKAGNNAAASDIIRGVYQFFRTIINSELDTSSFFGDFYDGEPLLKIVAGILSNIDTGIISAARTEREKNAYLEKISEHLPDDIRDEILKQTKFEFFFTHEAEHEESALFKLEQESDGTQKLFQFLPILVTAFGVGATLIIDELDNSFHPHLGELIIKLFNDPNINRNHAQLIYTTHDIKLMSPTLMRRDQVWFTEKNLGATNLYSLDEFDKSTVKSNSPFNHWYDEGRFGALPKINYDEISTILTDALKDTYEEQSSIIQKTFNVGNSNA